MSKLTDFTKFLLFLKITTKYGTKHAILNSNKTKQKGQKIMLDTRKLNFYRKKTGPKTKRPDAKTLFDWRKSHSVEECAKHFNVSRTTIYRWTNYYLELQVVENVD